MKRICTVLLLLTLLLTSLSSCYPTTEYGTQSSIRLTSSDAERYGDLLTDRLGDTCGNVVLGIGKYPDYDIDMADFEDDGYIFKTVGNETLIFGKTASGLDLACRRYANDIKISGKAIDTAYHEGYRIDDLKLFGNDISEYSVVYPNDCESAALEFARLIKYACGVELNITDESDSGKAVRFTLSDDDSLGEHGYRYYEKNGDLYFEVADSNTAVSAVCGFFEDECLWNGLTHGEGELEDHESLNIPDGIDNTVIPAFDSLRVGKTDVYYIEKSETPRCFSDGKYSSMLSADIQRYLKTYSINSYFPKEIGIVIGNDYCQCSVCQDVLSLEKSTAATVISLVNSLADDLGESYPDISIKLFVNEYAKAPVNTVPADNVSVVLSTDKLCLIHDLTGKYCSDSVNAGFSDTVSGWLERTENVIVSFDDNGDSLIQYYSSSNIYNDLRHLYSLGVKSVHIESSNLCFGLQKADAALAYSLNRNIGMTHSEYEEKLCDALASVYGNGWVFVREYVTLLEDSLDTSLCGNFSDNSLHFDNSRFANNYGTAIAYAEAAADMACSEEQEKFCELLACHIYYMGCMSAYYDAYYSLDKDTVSLLCEQYELIPQTLEKYGLKISDANGICGSPAGKLYDAAWHDWVGYIDLLYNGDVSDTKELTEFCDRVNENISDGSFTLAFRTDTHYSCEVSNGQKANTAKIMDERNSVAKYVDIDLFVHGGDLINGKHDNKSLAIQSITEAVSIVRGVHQTVPSFFIRGNHDDNSWYGNDKYVKLYDAFPIDTVVTSEEWRELTGNDKFDAFVTDETGSYGYFDDEESKIRVIMLDTSDIPYYDNGEGSYKYGAYSGHGIRQDQLQFMADAMMFTDKGDEASEWAILVVSHVPIETMKTVTTNYRFGGLDAAGRNFYAFLRLLKAYQRGTSFNEKQLSLTNQGDGGYASNGKWADIKGDFAYEVTADFSKNGPGEVIGMIAGHTHVNNYSNEVGKISYTSTIIYPELSYGYSYFCVGGGGMSVFTVERTGDGTGTIYVDHFGKSTVVRADMIAEGDNAAVTVDSTMFNAVTSVPDTGSVASGSYSVKYSQNR